MIKGRAQCLILAIVLGTALVTNAQASKVADRPEVASLIQELVQKHQFSKKELEKLFSEVELLPRVIERITTPYESLPWHRYRQIFLKEKRIAQGVEFWEKNAAALMRAEREYGVPSEIIVAIIGVESRYGQHKGGYRLVDSLTTLMLDYPRRSQFFRTELKEFLLLAREEGFDPRDLKGSYAGAMGKPQFISSSYRSYAVDFNGDGVRDLLNSTDDAIGSVANYFKRHGWQRGKPIATRAQIEGTKHVNWVKKGIKPKLSLAEGKRLGVTWQGNYPADTRSALIELESENGKEYWLGMKNFYVITRYNHSQLYAMAVYQLSEEIRKHRARYAAASS